jgi:hypothetical protein
MEILIYYCSHDLAVRLQREEELKAGTVATAEAPAPSAGSGVSLHRQQKAVSTAAGGGSADDSGTSGSKEKKSDVSLLQQLAKIELGLLELICN